MTENIVFETRKELKKRPLTLEDFSLFIQKGVAVLTERGIFRFIHLYCAVGRFTDLVIICWNGQHVHCFGDTFQRGECLQSHQRRKVKSRCK